MIYFNVNIRNPWWWDRFESIKCWFSEPKNNKCWEVEVMKCEELFRIEFQYTIRQDHAGLSLELGLLGYKIDIRRYDIRHWNPTEGRWMIYTEEQGLH